MATGWRQADAVASLLVAVLIVPRTVVLLRESVDVLLEATPKGVDLADVERHIREAPGVIDVHDLHAWTITSGMNVVSAHVVLGEDAKPGDILDHLGDVPRRPTSTSTTRRSSSRPRSTSSGKPARSRRSTERPYRRRGLIPAATMRPTVMKKPPSRCRTCRRSHARGFADPARSASSVAPDAVEVAEPRVVEACGLRWIHIDDPRLADREWLEAALRLPSARLGGRLLAQPALEARRLRRLPLHRPALPGLREVVRPAPDGGARPVRRPGLPDHASARSPLPPLQAMFERMGEREELRESTFSKGSGYLLYKIVDTNVDAAFPMLRKMGNKLDQLEDDILEGRSSEIVRDLSNAKQEIINFRRIVRPQRAVLRDLERTKQRYLAEEMEIYFDDISDAAERIWDTLENYKEVVEALESTNESVLSHRLNDSFRILTAASVILLPLTLIASIYGMNVPVPGENEPFSFWFVLAVMGLMLAGLVLIFRRRGWL